jgi:hypothetical protein
VSDEDKRDEPVEFPRERQANPTTHPEPTHPVPPPPSRGPGRVLVDEHAMSVYIDIPVKTLRNWRSLGEGPPYVKVGVRVRYDLRAVDRWLNKHTVGAA